MTVQQISRPCWSKEIGAEGYAPDEASAVKKARKLSDEYP